MPRLELLAQPYFEVLDPELPDIERPSPLDQPVMQLALLVGVQVLAALPERQRDALIRVVDPRSSSRKTSPPTERVSGRIASR